jgi:hypothetical protein
LRTTQTPQQFEPLEVVEVYRRLDRRDCCACDQPFLVALLAMAIFLLTVASLPRPAFSDSRANQILPRHRMEIAGLGAAAFLAVLIALLL